MEGSNWFKNHWKENSLVKKKDELNCYKAEIPEMCWQRIPCFYCLTSPRLTKYHHIWTFKHIKHALTTMQKCFFSFIFFPLISNSFLLEFIEEKEMLKPVLLHDEGELRLIQTLKRSWWGERELHTLLWWHRFGGVACPEQSIRLQWWVLTKGVEHSEEQKMLHLHKILVKYSMFTASHHWPKNIS